MLAPSQRLLRSTHYIQMESVKDSSAEPRSSRVDLLRADGNAAFKAGDLAKAKKLYSAAVSLVEGTPDESVEKLQPTQRAQLLANRCQVNMALERHTEALLTSFLEVVRVGVVLAAWTLRTVARIADERLESCKRSRGPGRRAFAE